MPPVTIKLYSLLFKLLLRRRLSSSSAAAPSPFSSPTCPSNPSFSTNPDNIATKDLHIDPPNSSLSLRIFLPNPTSQQQHQHPPLRRNSFANPNPNNANPLPDPLTRRASFNIGSTSTCASSYSGYLPARNSNRSGVTGNRRLPVIIQFHGGAFVWGSADSAANDVFCRRIARLCDAIVVAVGYRLASESRYPAAFEDGVKVVSWIAKQVNLARCGRGGGVDSFGVASVEPWIAAHADPSRFNAAFLYLLVLVV